MIDFKQIYEEEHIKNGLSYSEIRTKYNIPRGTWDYYIRKKLHLSCDRRFYKANDDFFNIIDSEIKAYLLGFLYADGYLASDGRMGIRLAIKDECMIKLIKQYICPESPIKYTNNQNIHRMPQVSIRWKSKTMLNRLQELGFCVDKTHTNSTIFENIPDEFKNDFIRGYCDGDGCVRFDLSKNKRYRKCAILFSNGSKQILEDIFNWFALFTDKGNLKNCKNYWTLSYETAFNSYYVVSKLYKNATFYLKRKRDIALQIINYRTNTELTGKHKRFPVV